MERRSKPRRPGLAPTQAGTAAATLALAVALVLVAVTLRSHARPRLAPGDPVPRIQCPPRYTAKVWVQGLRTPDGLAISPAGVLHVVEEVPGRVSRVDAAGSVVRVLTGLDSPEGITFDPLTGALYVVEDEQDGRLIKRSANGTVTTLARNLEAPEGVTWADGTLYLTESNLQYADVRDLRTRITAVTEPASITRVITHTPQLSETQVFAWSYAGITAGPGGLLYATNELSGYEITRTVVIVPGVLTKTLTLTSRDSVFAIDPAAGTRELLAGGLTAPEGLAFSPGGTFPLYVVEEDLGEGEGRLTAVQADGQHAPFCTGFLKIEDVVVDAEGTLYVSEDGSGMVIAIEREPEPEPIQADFEGSPRTGIVPLTVVFQNTSTGSYQTRLWDLGDGERSILEHPVHTYTIPGSYTVSLTITGPAGSDTQTKTGYVTALRGLYLPLVMHPK